MLVLVYNDALVRYISRVLPSLGAAGVPVTTFERWAAKLRASHLKGLPEGYHDETPSAVTKLKKHQRMLEVIEGYVAEVAARVEKLLVEATRGVEGAAEALAYWREQSRAPVALRLHRLDKWASPEEDPDAALNALARGREAPARAAPKSIALRHAIERTISGARRELLDVSHAWAEILTDFDRLAKAFAEDSADLDAEDLASAHRWCVDKCGLVLAELDQKRDEGGLKPRKSERPGAGEDGDDKEKDDDPSLRFVDGETPGKKLVARRRSSEDDGEEEDDDRSVGIDGAEEVEAARLDREDDALLLRITQRLRGPLLRGTGKQAETLRYEHILIDEAQDLSPVELAVVMGTTTKQRSVTMAGDVAQRLHMDNGFKSWSQLLEAVDPRKAEGEGAPIEVSPLKVQYRSTHPIIELAQDVLGPLADPGAGHAIRSGAPVELFQFAHSGEAVAYLGEALRELMQAEPRASVCLVARYPEQADLYYKGLQTAEVPHLRRIADQDFPFRAGIDVTDVRQVKGLEFDYVVLLECSRAVYPVTDECRHLLHIAVTRAAHQLWVTTTGDPSLVLPESLRNRAY
jgi:DNA helicase-2/ATP-dependent DNA helicase PcrA